MRVVVMPASVSESHTGHMRLQGLAVPEPLPKALIIREVTSPTVALYQSATARGKIPSACRP